LSHLFHAAPPTCPVASARSLDDRGVGDVNKRLGSRCVRYPVNLCPVAQLNRTDTSTGCRLVANLLVLSS
jgi:hypothetical protein